MAARSRSRIADDKLLPTRLTARNAAIATQFSGSATLNEPTGGMKKKLKQRSAATDVTPAAQKRVVAATTSTTRRNVRATVALLLTVTTRVKNAVTSATPPTPARARTQSGMALHRVCRLTPQPVDSFLPMIAGQLFFECGERRRNHVAMVQVGTNVLHGINPQMVDAL